MGTDDLFKKREKTTKFARQKPNLNPKKVILIVCEGEKTEINYFTRLKEFLNLTNIHIKSGKHSAPMQIVKTAQEISSDYDEIYCVFDKDKHGDFDKALQEVQECKFNEIVSAPCFEFWILLHFIFTDKAFKNCDEVRKHKNFKDNLCDYQKDYDFKELIEQYLQTAINNANQVNKINLKEKKPPYTQVVELVERLQELGRK